MMSTVIVPVIAANIAAQNASRIVQQRHAEACYNTIVSFDSKEASVQAMQSYASCVQFLHPVENSRTEIETKVVVAILLLGILIGAIVGFIRSYDDKCMDSIFGGAVGLLTVMVGMLIFGGVYYVFS